MGIERSYAAVGSIRLERKLEYLGYVTGHNSLEQDVMFGPMPGPRRQGGQRRQWQMARRSLWIGYRETRVWLNLWRVTTIRAPESRSSYRILVAKGKNGTVKRQLKKATENWATGKMRNGKIGQVENWATEERATGLTKPTFLIFVTFGHFGAQSWAPECPNVRKIQRWVRDQ